MTKQKKIIIAISLLAFVLLLCFIASQAINAGKKEKETVNATGTIQIEEEIEKEELEAIKQMTEKQRITTYFSKYLEYIECGKYEKAYELLYPDFKGNYFNTLEKFTQYAKELYPPVMVVDYRGMDRQGHYFIVYVDITNPFSSDELIVQKFVIYENDYNDFTLSFEVI